MDSIILYDCSFLCNLGVSEEERKTKQEILIDVEIFTDISKAASSDEVNDTINYEEVHAVLKDIIEKTEYNLLERISDTCAKTLLGSFSLKKVRVTVKKPAALASKGVRYAAVVVERP